MFKNNSLNSVSILNALKSHDLICLPRCLKLKI